MTIPNDIEEYLAARILPFEGDHETLSIEKIGGVLWRSDPNQVANDVVVVGEGENAGLLAVPAPEPRPPGSYKNALNAFLALARPGASNNQVRNFARRYGPLGVDAEGSISGWYDWGQHGKAAEPIRWYRYYARLAAAIKRLADCCHGKHPPYAVDVRLLRDHATKAWWGTHVPASFRIRSVVQGKRNIESHEEFWALAWNVRGVTAAGLDLDVASIALGAAAGAMDEDVSEAATLAFTPEAYGLVAAAVDWWIASRGIEPRLMWGEMGHENAGPPRVAWTGALWGALASQLITAIRYDAGFALCAGCDEPVRRRRSAAPGRPAWCSRKACQRKRAREGMKRLAERRRATKVTNAKQSKERRNAKA